MVQFDSIKIKELAVHQVGNKILQEGIEFSKSLANIEEDNIQILIKRYFFSPFSGNEIYNFQNSVGIELNEIYAIANRIFTENDVFFDQTKFIAQFLYENSNHPKIKGGELYISYFEGVLYENELVDAIGIFKNETKENYIKSNIRSKTSIIIIDEGTNINKLDKGCLIFNKDKESGYVVSIIDNTNKGSESQYWKDNFLNVKPIKNEYNQTNQFLGVTKQFVTKQLSEEFEVSKTDQIDFLNRSVNYFKNNETFKKQDFENEVFGDDSIVESFRDFSKNYEDKNEIKIEDSFPISTLAVKKQARVFKSVLKLDKNFHIYIHGKRELIEKGVDENGKKFYKIYYEEEN